MKSGWFRELLLRLGFHLNRTREADGSIPFSSTILLRLFRPQGVWKTFAGQTSSIGPAPRVGRLGRIPCLSEASVGRRMAGFAVAQPGVRWNLSLKGPENQVRRRPPSCFRRRYSAKATRRKTSPGDRRAALMRRRAELPRAALGKTSSDQARRRTAQIFSGLASGLGRQLEHNRRE